MKKLMTAAFVVALMMSCGSAKDAGSTKSLNGEWDITEVNGIKINAGDCENVPFLGFNGSKKSFTEIPDAICSQEATAAIPKTAK